MIRYLLITLVFFSYSYAITQKEVSEKIKKMTFLEYKEYKKTDEYKTFEKERKEKIQKKKSKKVSSKQESCMVLGYKFGSCATRSLMGLKCLAGTNITIPPRCRGKTSTKKGIDIAVKAEYDIAKGLD